LIALAAGFAIAYGFHHQLIDWLSQPLPPGRRHPVTFGVAEPFMTSLKVSLYAGFALALPVILWQLWSFLAPALDKRLQRSIFNYDSHIYNIQIRASSYYSFALLSLIAVGIVSELPIFILALVRIGVLSSAKLRRNRRIGYVAMAALAVALPGVDPVTTAFEMVPLMGLFELSVWLSVLFERRWQLQTSVRTALKA
jgi:sec-independent protein translocase protein TatC